MKKTLLCQAMLTDVSITTTDAWDITNLHSGTKNAMFPQKMQLFLYKKNLMFPQKAFCQFFKNVLVFVFIYVIYMFFTVSYLCGSLCCLVCLYYVSCFMRSQLVGCLFLLCPFCSRFVCRLRLTTLSKALSFLKKSFNKFETYNNYKCYVHYPFLYLFVKLLLTIYSDNKCLGI